MELRLILGDQLNSQHAWFDTPNEQVTFVLMQLRSETDYCQHHVQKVVGIFMAMEAFADALIQQGHRVLMQRIDDATNQHTVLGNLQQIMLDFAAAGTPVTSWRYQCPDEQRMDDALKSTAEVLAIDCQVDDSEHFLNPRDGFRQIFKPQAKTYRMETFYRAMRKRHHILLDESGEPEGGAWNYDQANRSAYDHQVRIPEPLSFPGNCVDDWPSRLHAMNINTLGEVGEHLDWPITRAQSVEVLDYFIKHLLAHFGRYQDAMLQHHDTLFHSRLSFALNLKMLHPREVIEAVEQAYRRGEADIAAVEGFIRQILGWREYVRCFYWQQYPTQAGSNFFAHERALPSWFWTGETHMACLNRAISQSLQTAYAHHIQRLMVTGNFMLLAGINPTEVNAWYLGIYADAIEWVQWPNTHAMSQFAEGGAMASKPYIASGAYIKKQGDHCHHCRYDVKQKLGDNACPFNSLYWHFVNRHEAVLKQNPRMSLITAQWAKQAPEAKQAIIAQAERNLIRVEQL